MLHQEHSLPEQNGTKASVSDPILMFFLQHIARLHPKGTLGSGGMPIFEQFQLSWLQHSA